MRETILVIEDDSGIRNVLVELFSSAGFTVYSAGDGVEALQIFHKQKCDLVLLDIMMPRLDGYGVCEVIRSEGNVPIIMLTALDEEDAQIKAYEMQIDDYITKPFSIKLVLHWVEAVLRRVREREGNIDLSNRFFRKIRIDENAIRVFVEEVEVNLTKIEFELLLLFVKNSGKVFIREELISKVWGYDYDGYDNAVNIHIMNLRKKLQDNTCIESVRGVGYRLGKEN